MILINIKHNLSSEEKQGTLNWYVYIRKQTKENQKGLKNKELTAFQ